MKPKILFILSTNGVGGIITSFISLYNEIKNNYDIKVLFLISNDGLQVPFSEKVITEGLLRINFDAFSSLNFLQKIAAFVIKPYKNYQYRKGNTLMDIIARPAANRLMRKYNFDVVVGFSEGNPTKLASFFRKAKRVSWIHCDYARHYETTIRKDIEKRIYNNIDSIVSVSEFTNKSFLSIFPECKDRAVVINNLMDFTRIRRMSEMDVDDERFVNDCFTLVSVGRVDPVKRYSLIPEIAKRLKENGFIFKWYIIGPEAGQEEIKKLRDGILLHDVEKEVIWLGGKKNPYSYMSRSDLYVCLSFSEACPMVFIEAKMLGLPVVTTKFGSASEFIIDGKEGLIVELDTITVALRNLIADNRMREGMRLFIKNKKYDNSDSIKKVRQLLSAVYD